MHFSSYFSNTLAVITSPYTYILSANGSIFSQVNFSMVSMIQQNLLFDFRVVHFEPLTYNCVKNNVISLLEFFFYFLLGYFAC